MTKIEKNKKICAMLISTSLIATLAGCGQTIYENELYIYDYDGATIRDKNTGITIYIPETIRNEIISSNNKTYTVNFGNNNIDLETSLLKKGLIEQQKRTKKSNFIKSALIISLLGCEAIIKHKSSKTSKDKKESFDDKKEESILVKSAKKRYTDDDKKEKSILVKSAKKRYTEQEK